MFQCPHASHADLSANLYSADASVNRTVGDFPICWVSNRLRLEFRAFLADGEFLGRQETKVECIAHNLCAGLKPELLREARAVSLHRLGADVNLLCDLAATETFGDKFQPLQLTVTQYAVPCRSRAIVFA